jgi:hypothetical protein
MVWENDEQMKTADEIRSYIREQLVLAVETKAAKYDDESWTKGVRPYRGSGCCC